MPPEEMSDHELLMELIADKRKRDIFRYVKIGAAVVIIALLAFFIIKYIKPLVGYVEEISSSASQMDELLAQMDVEELENLSEESQLTVKSFLYLLYV